MRLTCDVMACELCVPGAHDRVFWVDGAGKTFPFLHLYQLESVINRLVSLWIMSTNCNHLSTQFY